MRLFGRRPKTARDRLLELAAEWRKFESVELNRPGLERTLRYLGTRIEQELDQLKPALAEAANTGTAQDVDFLFDLLVELPVPPAQKSPPPNASGFTWERAEAELGAVARVVNGIRVPIQLTIRQNWQERIRGLERKLQLSGPTSIELARELDSARSTEREELGKVDEVFRRYLVQLMRLHDLAQATLDALVQVTNPEGAREILTALRSDDRRYRNLGVKVLQARAWKPASTQERLDFLCAKVKLPGHEAEASRGLLELIRSTTDVRELLEVIEHQLAEEGLTELQGKLLEHLCSLHSEKALDRLAAVLASSLEPAALKVKVCAALPEIGTPRAVQLLVGALDELDTEVRTAAAQALGRVGALSGRAQQLTELDPELRTAAMERLVFALRDGDVSVREAAAKSLRYYPTAREKLVSTLTEDRNPNAREYAGLALSAFEHEPSSTAALVRALGDEDAAVRKAAATALARQGQVPDEPADRIRYLCANQSWKEVQKVGAAATQCLVSLLRDRNENVRMSVVATLGQIRARDAVRELGISLSDSHQDVRREAAIALRLIGDPASLDALRTARAKEGFKEVRAEIEKTILKLEARAG